jgi:hypothetical protein
MKFCKDCKHIVLGGTAMTYAKCSKSKQVSPQFLVDAIPATEFSYCSTMRMDGQRCGPDAALFEPETP